MPAHYPTPAHAGCTSRLSSGKSPGVASQSSPWKTDVRATSRLEERTSCRESPGRKDFLPENARGSVKGDRRSFQGSPLPRSPFSPVFSRPNGCLLSAGPLPDLQWACDPNLRVTLRLEFLDPHGRGLGNHAPAPCCLNAPVARFVGKRGGSRIAAAGPAANQSENVAPDAPPTRKPRLLGGHRFALRRWKVDTAAIGVARRWTGRQFTSLESRQRGNWRRAEGIVSPLAGAKRGAYWYTRPTGVSA